jgi:hypothetical protein
MDLASTATVGQHRRGRLCSCLSSDQGASEYPGARFRQMAALDSRQESAARVVEANTIRYTERVRRRSKETIGRQSVQLPLFRRAPR